MKHASESSPWQHASCGDPRDNLAWPLARRLEGFRWVEGREECLRSEKTKTSLGVDILKAAIATMLLKLGCLD